jgi:hypothetical protein
MGRSSDAVDISVSAYHDRVVRTTLTLDDDVYQAALAFSQSSGEGLGKVVSKLARRGLQPPAPARKNKRRRFPVFDVAPGTRMMSLSRIQRFIDEEGFF